MFDHENFKAAGICYNNIANLQFKNQRYDLAAENYTKAINKSLDCLQGKLSETREPKTLTQVETYYFKQVHALRLYQFAICTYKAKKYDDKESWQYVDRCLRESIVAFQSILDPSSDTYLYIDLIVKLILMRVFANQQSRKFITA